MPLHIASLLSTKEMMSRLCTTEGWRIRIRIYCTISKIILVVVGSHHYIFVFQRWWWEGRKDEARGRQAGSRHPIRKTLLVHRSQERPGYITPPSPAGMIVQQVLVRHSCDRTNDVIARTCRVRSICTREDCRYVNNPITDVCEGHSCTFIEKDYHECSSLRNQTYEVPGTRW